MTRQDFSYQSWRDRLGCTEIAEGSHSKLYRLTSGLLIALIVAAIQPLCPLTKVAPCAS